MSLICRKLAAAAIISDVQGNDSYVQMDMTADAIVAAGQPFFAESQLPMSHAVLPFYYCMPKLHKAELAFRFIAASSKCYLRTAAIWVTRYMRGVEADMKRIWVHDLNSSK